MSFRITMITILHELQKWSLESPESICQSYRPGFNRNAEFAHLTVKELRNRILYTALALEAEGFEPGSIGAIYSYNCPQWVTLELALTLIRLKSVGLYPNAAPREIEYILKHTEAQIAGVQDKTFFQKLTSGNSIHSQIKLQIKLWISFDDDETFDPKAVSFSKLLEKGKAIADSRSSTRKMSEAEIYGEYIGKLNPKEGAFIIYTSGTTGEPKGALLSHDNLIFAAEVVRNQWKLPIGGGTLFSFLPLCHIAEKLQNIAGGIYFRYPVIYCTKMDMLTIELPQAKPTLLLCVPRVWEKIMEGVQSKLAQSKGIKKILGTVAFSWGEKIANRRQLKKSIPLIDHLLFSIFNRLVFSKIKAAVGFQNLTLGASGAAALPAYVSKWYQSMGLEILEDYGQTESTGIACMTSPGVESSGSVGTPAMNTDFKIAEDGEILTRGRHVFVGYLKNLEATKEVIDSDGWLHTGDLGIIDDRGLVCIRGRKKEIMKTSGGKMIAPVPIEDQVKVDPRISQVCMVGDGKKYFTALVTLSELGFNSLSSPPENKDVLIQDSAAHSFVQKQIDFVNSNLASYEKIKKFVILSRDFSIEQGEMTPTLKMKRSEIENNFKKIIADMYLD